MHTACVWSVKLPFAEYSIVKDHSGGNVTPRILSVIAGRFPPDPLGSLHSRGPKAPRRSLASVESLSGPHSLEPRAKGYGEYRARTGDLLVANQALSQLS
jgi:hypothetical protein